MLNVCSYKLWYKYLKLRRKQVRGKCVTDPAYEEVNNAFERSLVFMHKVRGGEMEEKEEGSYQHLLQLLPVTLHLARCLGSGWTTVSS